MKDLTEKAILYDEAVINGSRLWESGEITRESYEYIFPELAESKDEKIRKWLISQLKIKSDGTDSDLNIMIGKAIDWLEKQGRNKLVEWSEEDEKFFQTALWHISYSITNGASCDCSCDTTEWLKSLKERIQPK